jgi:membrane protease YdiL (CAAX protease family)
MALQVLPDDADRLARPATVIGFVLALFVPPLLSTSGIDTGPLVGNAIKWAIVAILLVIVVRFESDSLTSIGFVRPRLRDIGWALFLIVAVVGVFALTDPLVTALGLPTEQGIAQPSLAVGIGSAITAGITEEIMFRGYPIERLIDAGYGPVAAGGLTWALFTVAHVVRDTRPETCFRSRSRPSSSPWSTSASARSFPSSWDTSSSISSVYSRTSSVESPGPSVDTLQRRAKTSRTASRRPIPTRSPHP